MRLIKTFMVGALGLTLAATPVLAQEAAPLSLVTAAEGASSAGTTDYLLPGLAIIAVLAAAILLTRNEGDDDLDNPVSP